MNRLFPHISSDESTLDQRNNEQSTNTQPKKGEDQRNKYLTKHEENLCAICKRNFNTTRGLNQHQKKRKPSENTINVTVNNITVQPSNEIKF